VRYSPCAVRVVRAELQATASEVGKVSRRHSSRAFSRRSRSTSVLERLSAPSSSRARLLRRAIRRRQTWPSWAGPFDNSEVGATWDFVAPATTTRFQPRLPERHSVARYRRQYRDLVHERIADRFNRGTWKHTHHLDRPGRECGLMRLMRLARTISATKRRSGAGCNSSASTCRLLDPQDFSIAGA
jgi:hypothetical protein